MFAVANVEKVIRCLLRFGAAPADVEDLAQETLMVAWRRRDTYDRQRSLDGWLYGIARNVYRNHARGERRSPLNSELREQGVARAAEVEQVLAVRAAVQALPEDWRDLVVLHQLEGHTLKETAEILAVPFETAKDRLRRARNTLRATLDDSGAIERERRDAARVASGCAVGVLVGFLGALEGLGAAHAGASQETGVAPGTAAAAAPAAGIASGKLAVVAAALAGVAVGGLGHWLISDPTPPRAAQVAVHERVGTTGMLPAVEPDGALLAPAPVDAGIALLPAADARPAAAIASSTRPSASTTAPAEAAPAVAPAEAAPSVAAVPVDQPAAPGGPAVDAEAQLLERARTALARGEPAASVRTLMAHARRFPDGQLVEERDVLLIDAYLAAGEPGLARRRIEHYRRAHPAGLHRARVAAAERQLARTRSR